MSVPYLWLNNIFRDLKNLAEFQYFMTLISHALLSVTDSYLIHLLSYTFFPLVTFRAWWPVIIIDIS